MENFILYLEKLVLLDPEIQTAEKMEKDKEEFDLVDELFKSGKEDNQNPF